MENTAAQLFNQFQGLETKTNKTAAGQKNRKNNSINNLKSKSENKDNTFINKLMKAEKNSKNEKTNTKTKFEKNVAQLKKLLKFSPQKRKKEIQKMDIEDLSNLLHFIKGLNEKLKNVDGVGDLAKNRILAKSLNILELELKDIYSKKRAINHKSEKLSTSKELFTDDSKLSTNKSASDSKSKNADIKADNNFDNNKSIKQSNNKSKISEDSNFLAQSFKKENSRESSNKIEKNAEKISQNVIKKDLENKSAIKQSLNKKGLEESNKKNTKTTNKETNIENIKNDKYENINSKLITKENNDIRNDKINPEKSPDITNNKIAIAEEESRIISSSGKVEELVSKRFSKTEKNTNGKSEKNLFSRVFNESKEKIIFTDDLESKNEKTQKKGLKSELFKTEARGKEFLPEDKFRIKFQDSLEKNPIIKNTEFQGTRTKNLFTELDRGQFQSSNNIQEPVNQILEKLELNHKPGFKSLEIKLEPKSLGKLKIDLQLDNKQLTAKISVENSHVKHYLNHNLSSLKSGLLKQGFNPDNISIETDSQGFDMQDESFSDQQQGSSNGRQEDDYNFSPEQFSALKSELLEEMDGEIWEEGNIVKKINYWRGMNYVYHRMDLFA